MPDRIRDADATRRRLLDAARDEFAAVGVAGARVDRIAAAAQSNKAQIYHYFGSKEGLFEAVFDAMVAETVDEVPITADDLPGYAVRLYESYLRRPWVQRLATWHRLERGGSDSIAAVSSSYARKAAAIADAQRRGVVTDRYSAVEALGLVLTLAAMWSAAVPEFDRDVDSIPEERRKDVVASAVRAIVAP